MRCCGLLTGRGSALWAGVRLGLLTAAQLFIGEELLVDTAVAAVIVVAVLALGQPRASHGGGPDSGPDRRWPASAPRSRSWH